MELMQSMTRVALVVTALSAAACGGVDSQADDGEETDVSEGAVAPCPTLCGDANLDGKVTVTDAVKAQHIAAGLETLAPGSCAFKAADVNHSGSITVTDAVVIQKIAAGLPAPVSCVFGPFQK